MPGFTADMIPALRIDYGVVGRRVDRFEALSDNAASREEARKLAEEPAYGNTAVLTTSDGSALELMKDGAYRSEMD
jgi:hypothetical protein